MCVLYIYQLIPPMLASVVGSLEQKQISPTGQMDGKHSSIEDGWSNLFELCVMLGPKVMLCCPDMNAQFLYLSLLGSENKHRYNPDHNPSFIHRNVHTNQSTHSFTCRLPQSQWSDVGNGINGSYHITTTVLFFLLILIRILVLGVWVTTIAFQANS